MQNLLDFFFLPNRFFSLLLKGIVSNFHLVKIKFHINVDESLLLTRINAHTFEYYIVLAL